MKKNIITTVLLFISIIAYSQKDVSKLEKKSKSIFELSTKTNLWVLDTIYGFTGLGSNDWEFDQTEIVKTRNLSGLPLVIELTEKIEGTADWVNVYLAEFTYFDNNSVFEYTVKEWNTQTNNWNTQLSYYNKFDEEGKLIENFIRFWDNTEQYFYQGNKELYVYDATGLKITKEDQDWYEGSWDQYFKTFYTYDENDNNILELQKRYNGSQWNDNWETVNTFNDFNQLTLSHQNGYDSEWAEWFNYSETAYSYYSTNALLEEEYTQRYDTNASEWYDLSRTTYYYNDNNLLDYKEEMDLEVIDYSLKYEYTYNTNLEEESFFLYSYNNKGWTLFYKVYDIFDENFNQTSYYSETLDGTWKNMLKEEYTWNVFQTNSINNISENIKIYPNPVSEILKIEIDENATFTIYNYHGKQVISTKEKEINVSSLSKGMYILNIKNLNLNISKKIIVQ